MCPHTADAPAGHAHHFLSRLDRVARAHVEVALMLYRDDDLLRFILDRARLPEGVDRVALSLDDATRGPFLIVTRDGRFVTCLGAGMKPTNRMIVTRAQLDGHIARARDVRARNEALIDLGDRAKDVYKRIIEAGDELTREQIVAASASATPIRPHLVGHAADVIQELYKIRRTVVPILRRTKNPRAVTHPMLRIYWNLAFAAGHLTVLASVDGPGLVEKLPMLVSEDGLMLSLLTVEQGIMAVALKGVWAAGKVGRELLPAYKRVLAESTCQLRIADAALGLTVLGLRHARLRAEVHKALGAPHDGVDRPDETRALAAALCRTGCAVLDDPAKGRGAPRVRRLALREADGRAPRRLAVAPRAARGGAGGSRHDHRRLRLPRFPRRHAAPLPHVHAAPLARPREGRRSLPARRSDPRRPRPLAALRYRRDARRPLRAPT